MPYRVQIAHEGERPFFWPGKDLAPLDMSRTEAEQVQADYGRLCESLKRWAGERGETWRDRQCTVEWVKGDRQPSRRIARR